MIFFQVAGYTLRQFPPREVVYVTTPQGTTRMAYCGKLTKDNAAACIIAIGE